MIRRQNQAIMINECSCPNLRSIVWKLNNDNDHGTGGVGLSPEIKCQKGREQQARGAHEQFLSQVKKHIALFITGCGMDATNPQSPRATQILLVCSRRPYARAKNILALTRG